MSIAKGEQREVRKAMITGLRWLATARLVAQVSSWAITLVVIRLLTPTDYGLQAMVAVIYTLLVLVTQSGLDRAIARQPEFGTADLQQMLGFSLMLSALIMASMWIAAPYVAAYYQEEAVIPLLRVLAVGFVISVFHKIPIGLVWRSLDYRSHAVANLIGTFSASLVTLSLALLGYGVWALILGMLVSPAVAALYLQLRTRWLVMPRLGLAGLVAIRPLIIYVWTVSLGFFVWSFARRLGILIGGQQLTAEMLGFYAVAVNLCGLPLSRVVPLANEVLYPAYAKLQQDRGAVTAYFEKSLASVCFVLFPAFFGLAAISEWLVPIVFGPHWIGVEQVMIIVALAMPFQVVSAMCNPLLNATGKAMTSLWTGVFAIILTATAVLIGVRWGVIGLAGATLAATPILMFVVVWCTRGTSGVSPLALAAKIGPTWVMSAVMGLVVYWIGTATTNLLPNAGVFTLQVACGVLLYSALAVIFCRNQLLSSFSIIRSSLKRDRKKSNQ